MWLENDVPAAPSAPNTEQDPGGMSLQQSLGVKPDYFLFYKFLESQNPRMIRVGRNP